MEIEKPDNPFTWDVRLDKSLQRPIKIVATKENKQIREYISDILRNTLQQVGEKVDF